VTLIDAYASVESGEAWLHQLDIGGLFICHARNQ